jgi:hypothetical protein
VVGTPASYSGGPGFKSRTVNQPLWLSLFVVFLSSSWKLLAQQLKLDHDATFHILSNSFIYHLIILAIYPDLLTASLNRSHISYIIRRIYPAVWGVHVISQSHLTCFNKVRLGRSSKEKMRRRTCWSPTGLGMMEIKKRTGVRIAACLCSKINTAN